MVKWIRSNFSSRVLVEDYYREIFNTACSKQIGTYLDTLAHKNPGLKILEVGTGTGGMTKQVLAAFQSGEIPGWARYAQYDYIDISGSYFEKVEETLGDGPRKFKFKLLNIEHDPIKQGFESGTYDLTSHNGPGQFSFLQFFHSHPRLISDVCFMLPGAWIRPCRMFVSCSSSK
jgi:hypothetical protein